MKTWVISLGGSLIAPEKMDVSFLEKFRALLEKYRGHYRFVIVCGGGTIARKYIDALAAEGKPKRELAIAGIRATRMNALFMMQLFDKLANRTLPVDIHEVATHLQKNHIVICGALRYESDATSDSTAAKIAYFLDTDFVNITNIRGLYSADPSTHPNAKFISSISWKDFEAQAHSLKPHPGQHFVLDQNASTIIHKHKIRTFIIGKSIAELNHIFEGKPFEGTLIGG